MFSTSDVSKVPPPPPPPPPSVSCTKNYYTEHDVIAGLFLSRLSKEYGSRGVWVDDEYYE